MAGARVQPLGSDDPERLGQYQLLGRLGSGGMGRVYLGRTGGGRLVAVKTLLAEGVVSDTDRRRFAREVALAQRVNSTYTARVLDADAAAERPWMAIEYIAAPSLAELVRTEGVLPASAVRWVAAGTAEALVTLHRQGIVHRDVKPQNILLPLAGPRLIDFGISHASDITRTQLTLGTIAFTSPEQARGEESTAASDVYSLGATLFHLAVGRPPYPEDGDTLRLLSRVQRGELDLTGLPKELTPLIRPCLAARPEGRPSPGDVLDQFTASLSGLPRSPGGGRWLPPRWTDLIGAYETQGRHFQSAPGTGGPDALTVDQRTGAVPPPGPTRMYTQDRARADRERRERELRAERERAAALLADRARQAREEAERARARAGSSPGQGAPPRTPGPVPRPTPAPPPTPPSPKSGVTGGTVLAVLVGIAVILYLLNNGSDSDGTKSSGSSGSSGYTSSSGYTTSTGGSSSSGSSSGGSSSGGYRYTPPPSPTPNSVDLAYRNVDTGDCLNTYDNGYGRWSSTTPQVVSCGSPNAYLRVTRASQGINFGSCPTGTGRHYLYHSGSRYNFATSLCVERQFHKGQCFIAKRSGTTVTDSRLMGVWSCNATKVPSGYNTILQITGYYKAQKSYPNGFCSRSRDDRNYYWWYEVDGGRNVLCTTTV
ncbi:serine/threonine-protein kinase [Streptomyces purpureus]|uniref:serine/threonine-protein kinase n=1 Tax=Streptomyces purpureus TaxID=1951 RepID=UPI0037A73DAB